MNFHEIRFPTDLSFGSFGGGGAADGDRVFDERV